MKSDNNFSMPLGKENYILLAIGFAIIVIGFILMVGGGSKDPTVFNTDELFSFTRVTLSPLLILFGFIFEIYAIMKKPKDSKEISDTETNN